MPKRILLHFERCAKVFMATLCLVCLSVLTACWVSSVHGLDEEELFRPDPDITFDDSLKGIWQQTKDSCTTDLTVSGSNRTYDLELEAQGKTCSDAGNKAHYLARLVKLDGHFFLDVYPMPADVCEMCMALHWIFLVKFDKTNLAMIPIDSEWLKQASGEKTMILTTLPKDTDTFNSTITSPAKDLKTFCRKYADNVEVFKPDLGISFKRK